MFYAALLTACVGVTIGRTQIPGGMRMYVVLTGSMHPSLPAGSLIITSPKQTYVPGDIISFTNPRSRAIVTHRIVSVTKDTYTTKGDRNASRDFEPVHISEIVGRVMVVIPYVGHLVSFIKTPLGFVVCLIIPGVFVVVSESRVIVSEARKLKKHTTRTPNVSQSSSSYSLPFWRCSPRRMRDSLPPCRYVPLLSSPAAG